MNSFEVKRVDLWDGGDRHNFGFYISVAVPDAEITKAHQHCAISTQVLTVFDSLQEVKDNSHKALRKSAWQKLSSLERQALNMLEEPK